MHDICKKCHIYYRHKSAEQTKDGWSIATNTLGGRFWNRTPLKSTKSKKGKFRNSLKKRWATIKKILKLANK